jgi:hypothetical protein
MADFVLGVPPDRVGHPFAQPDGGRRRDRRPERSYPQRIPAAQSPAGNKAIDAADSEVNTAPSQGQSIDNQVHQIDTEADALLKKSNC